MRKLLHYARGLLPLFAVMAPSAWGEDPAAALPVYVTRQDCRQLVAHNPAPDVAYQAGTDVHGRPVVPADLPSGSSVKLLPDRLTFDLKVNPLAYGAPLPATTGDKFSNTAAPIAHIEVDLASGAVRVNGHSLDNDQTRIVTEACTKAGYR